MLQKDRQFLLSLTLVASIAFVGLFIYLNGSAVLAQSGPTLQVASGLQVQEGGTLIVPLNYRTNGEGVAAMVFSIDYDEECLALDQSDADNNGSPDGIQFHLPASLFPSAILDLDDANGELDFIIADYFPPFVTLPDTSPLLELTFMVICVPPVGDTRTAAVTFSPDPEISFGGATGNSITGTASGSTITIVSNTPPTPTNTPTPTPTATPTATAMPTATATPTIVVTAPPTATPTLVPTAPPQTIVDEFAAVIQIDGIRLQWQTSQEVNTRAFTVRRLTLGQSSGFLQLSGNRASLGAQGGSYTYFDNSATDKQQYTYLLVEEKQNGRVVPYYDLIVTVDPEQNRSPNQRILLPLIQR